MDWPINSMVDLSIAIENGPVEIVDWPMNSMVLIFHSYVNVYQRVTPIFPRVHPIDLTGGCSIHLTGKLLLWQLWKIMWEMTGLLIKLALVHPCIIHIKIPYIIYIYTYIYIYIYNPRGKSQTGGIFHESILGQAPFRSTPPDLSAPE